MKGLIKQVRNAGNEFMKGYRLARYAQIGCINTIPTDLPECHDFEAQVSSLLAKHNVRADILITDTFNAGTLMSVISTFDLYKAGYSIESKNATCVLVDRINTMQNYVHLTNMKTPVFKGMTMDQMIEVIMAHEIGHIKKGHVHTEAQEERVKMNMRLRTMIKGEEKERLLMEVAHIDLRCEQEAWEAGRAIISKHLVPQYELFNQINMASYKHSYNTRLGKKVFV